MPDARPGFLSPASFTLRNRRAERFPPEPATSSRHVPAAVWDDFSSLCSAVFASGGSRSLRAGKLSCFFPPRDRPGAEGPTGARSEKLAPSRRNPAREDRATWGRSHATLRRGARHGRGWRTGDLRASRSPRRAPRPQAHREEGGLQVPCVRGPCGRRRAGAGTPAGRSRLGPPSQPPQTRWLRQHICSLTDLGLRSPRSRRRPMRSPARALVLACRWPASPCVPTRQGEGVLGSLPVLIKALIPSWGPLLPTASDPSRLPKAPPTFRRAARAPVDAKTESLTPFAHRRSLAAVSRHWAHGDRGTMAATPSQSSAHLGREHTQARPARTGEPRARGCSGAARRQARGSRRAQGLRWPNGVHSRP